MLNKIFKLPELIFLEIVKYFKDTLEGSDGKYSTKNTMIAQSFILCALGFIYETHKTQHVNIQMFDAFLYIAFGTSVLGSASNLLNKKIDTGSPEQMPITVTNTVTTIEKKEVE